jgi:pyruvate dehydrogenase E1 component beta subunit
MFADFVTIAMDQLINQAAKMRYMCKGRMSVPMVVRTAGRGGHGRGGAAFPEPRGVCCATCRG